MPPPLAHIRRFLGRLKRAGSAGSSPADGGGCNHAVTVVPVTVRTPTRDGADLRLLLDARVATLHLAEAEVQRITLALVVPAVAAWVAERALDDLVDTLGPRLRDVEEAVCHQTRDLGVDLVALDVVAVEHLIVSPSGPEAPATTTDHAIDTGGPHGNR